MTERYYMPPDAIAPRSQLTGPEAHHLLHVMRAKVGDEVTLFDGGGGEYAACVVHCGRQDVGLEVGPRALVDHELACRLVMGVALPKGERQKWLVEKLTELGAAELVPLSTERSVAKPRDSSLEKLRRAVIEAAKQCGRNKLMNIGEPTSIRQFLQDAEGSRLVAHPTGEILAKTPVESADCVSIVIGPEGGLTDDEVKNATELGWKCVRLGPSILRIETAAAAIAAIVAHAAGGLQSPPLCHADGAGGD